jgi:DNA repair exonuclease SbcCD nuclease subunit
MARIASTGDWHYGSGVDEDIERSMEFITQKVKEEKADAILLTGDIYQKESNVSSRNIAIERVKKLSEIAPVLMCYGNHDAPGDLDVFKYLGGNGRHPVKVYNTISVIKIEDVNIYALPWINKSHWLKSNYSQSGDVNANISSKLIEYLKNELKTNKSAASNIIFGHILVSGARAENNQMLIGEGITIGEYDFEELGFDAAIIGHIHLKQQFASGNTFYNGSPTSLNFGESSNKYFSIYDTDSKLVEWYKIPSVNRVTISGNIIDGVWVPDQDMVLSSYDRVRINYNISSSDDQDKAKEIISNYYSKFNLKEFKLKPLIKLDIATRSESVSKANTLKDKLLALWDSNGYRCEFDDKKRLQILDKLKRVEEMCTTKDSSCAE